MNTLEQIKVISAQLGKPNIYEDLLSRIDSTNRKWTAVGVIGTSNAGKSSLINGIAGTDIPVSYVSTMESHVVVPTTAWASSGNLAAKDVWTGENNIGFIEKHEEIFKEDSADIDFAMFFSDFDICLYLLDGQMAYTKNDALILENLEKFGIPTLICITKYELMQEENKLEVANYLKNKLPLSNNIQVLDAEVDSILNHIDAIKQFIIENNKIEEINFKRNSFSNFFVIDAIARLAADCSSKIDECRVAEEKVESLTSEKYVKISAKEADWMRIELNLSERRQLTEDKIRAHLSGRKADMLRRLSHDIEISSDIKQYWEKELGYRLDEMMRAELQSCTQLVNTDIITTLKWLQDEIIKSFKKQSSFTPTISCSVDGKGIVLDRIDLADNKNLKIVTRIGTAATVITAGTLLASSGVAGVVMAISMLSGLGADFLIGRKTKESREKVLALLPDILERSELYYLDRINTSLKDSYDEIINNIKKSHQEWKETAYAEIEEEKKIAIYNCGREKYLMCMEEINKLSEEILK